MWHSRLAVRFSGKPFTGEGAGATCAWDVVNSESPMKVRKYDYRRNLPHIELSGRKHFITFDTYLK
jgi:hypothetical protein